MKNPLALADKTAISLSLLCTLHCLALPVLLVAVPSLVALQLQDEAFHYGMLIAVIPISLIALGLGCKKHKNYSIALLGAAGLILMIVAVLFGHDIAGELGEKGLTLIGAAMIALAHWNNHQLCKKSCCTCPPAAE